jgi:uncharacterized repeat protein (TIGR04002 family)
MKRSASSKSFNLVLASLFAAIIFLMTAYFIHIPTGLSGGYIHLGDIFIYFAACLLPTPYAMAAAAIGGALSDTLTGSIIWAPATLVIKPLLVLYFTSRSEKFITWRNILAVFLAGITGLVGYYLAGAVITHSYIAPLLTLPVDAIQPAASGVFFLIIAFVLDLLGFKKRLKLN